MTRLYKKSNLNTTYFHNLGVSDNQLTSFIKQLNSSILKRLLSLSTYKEFFNILGFKTKTDAGRFMKTKDRAVIKRFLRQKLNHMFISKCLINTFPNLLEVIKEKGSTLKEFVEHFVSLYDSSDLLDTNSNELINNYSVLENEINNTIFDEKDDIVSSKNLLSKNDKIGDESLVSELGPEHRDTAIVIYNDEVLKESKNHIDIINDYKRQHFDFSPYNIKGYIEEYVSNGVALIISLDNNSSFSEVKDILKKNGYKKVYMYSPNNTNNDIQRLLRIGRLFKKM